MPAVSRAEHPWSWDTSALTTKYVALHSQLSHLLGQSSQDRKKKKMHIVFLTIVLQKGGGKVELKGKLILAQENF